MPLSPEAAEIVRTATIEALTRTLSADDVVFEVERLCRIADTPKDFYELGRMFKAVEEMGRRFVARQRELAGLKDDAPEPEPPTSAPAAAAQPVPDELEVA